MRGLKAPHFFEKETGIIPISYLFAQNYRLEKPTGFFSV